MSAQKRPRGLRLPHSGSIVRVCEPDHYPPIGDYALIGDCHSAALVSRRGSIDWCCLPRFDSGSAFGRLLDWDRGGHCSIAPTGGRTCRRLAALPRRHAGARDDVRAAGGEAQLIDCFTMHSGGSRPPAPARSSAVIEGVRGSRRRSSSRSRRGSTTARSGRGSAATAQRLYSAIGGNDGARRLVRRGARAEEPTTTWRRASRCAAGERRSACRCATAAPEMIDARGAARARRRRRSIGSSSETLRLVARVGRAGSQLDAPDGPGVERSAIVLKALTYAPTGAIVAAPTTSLARGAGRPRNWDYRFGWIRDSSFSVARARRARAATTRPTRSARFIHALGRRPRRGPPDHLRRRRRAPAPRADARPRSRATAASRPVRDRQRRRRAVPARRLRRAGRPHLALAPARPLARRRLLALPRRRSIDHAAERWQRARPRHLGMAAASPQHFVHSKVLCWAALDRGIRLADECMRRAPDAPLEAGARRDPRARSSAAATTRSAASSCRRSAASELDAALLLLPTVEFVAWDDERMVRTVDAIREELDAGDGLLHRYRARRRAAGGGRARSCAARSGSPSAWRASGELERGARGLRPAVATRQRPRAVLRGVRPASRRAARQLPAGADPPGRTSPRRSRSPRPRTECRRA